MLRQSDLVALPAEYHRCSRCSGQGENSHTRIRTQGDQGYTTYRLAHWCDRGRELTSEETFKRGGPDQYADVLIIGHSKEELIETWELFSRTPDRAAA